MLICQFVATGRNGLPGAPVQPRVAAALILAPEPVKGVRIPILSTVPLRIAVALGIPLNLSRVQVCLSVATGVIGAPGGPVVPRAVVEVTVGLDLVKLQAAACAQLATVPGRDRSAAVAQICLNVSPVHRGGSGASAVLPVTRGLRLEVEVAQVAVALAVMVRMGLRKPSRLSH